MTRRLADAEHVFTVSVDRAADDPWYTATLTADGRSWRGYHQFSCAAVRIALRARKRQLRHERKRHTAVSA